MFQEYFSHFSYQNIVFPLYFIFTTLHGNRISYSFHFSFLPPHVVSFTTNLYITKDPKIRDLSIHKLSVFLLLTYIFSLLEPVLIRPNYWTKIVRYIILRKALFISSNTISSFRVLSQHGFRDLLVYHAFWLPHQWQNHFLLLYFLYIIFPLLGHTRILFLFLTLVSMVKEYTLIEHRFKSILGFKHF